jgi:glycosyltransferase involved in cell wall biosynthesis
VSEFISFHQQVGAEGEASYPLSNGGSEHQSEHRNGQMKEEVVLPLVSLVVPAYNEALILEDNLRVLCDYMRSLESRYRWEVIVINDGSADDTGDRAEAFARTQNQVRVIHHLTNSGLGQALRTGFEHSRGDYIITLDLDLSYAPDTHIEKLLNKIQQTKAKVVVASPYMRGGQISNVPWFRLMLSVWANRFLSFAAKRSLATLTGMVRVYDAEFVHTLNLKSVGMDINPELIHKTQLLGGRVAEVPGHLRWHLHKSTPRGKRRRSSMRILRHSWSILFYGFMFRPVMFFIIPSLFFFLLSCYANAWVLIHCWTNYQKLALQPNFNDPTIAVAQAFQQAPHTFFIGGMTLMLAIQLFSLGILSMQSKSYFEEIFHLGTATYRSVRRGRRDKDL